MAGAASPLPLRLLRPGEPENDEEEEAATASGGRRRLLPRCSPTPRPRSPQEDAEEAAAVGPEASTGPRRVRFADALGLPLLELRNFCPETEPEIGPVALPVPYLEFSLPASEQQLLERLESGAALELESLGPCSAAEEEGDPPALRGFVRVRNLSYSKMVAVRASWDGWASFRDHPARYVPGSSDGVTDRFAFWLPCTGRRLEFVLRYQTPSEVFWANNQGRNYGVLLLPGTGDGILPPPACSAYPPLKSCLKPPRSRPDFSGIENGSDSSGWDDLSKLLKPSPLKAEHPMQVPELMVTGTPLEKRDFDSDHSVTFPEHNLLVDTEIKACAADQGKLPITLEMEQEARDVKAMVPELGAHEQTKEGEEEPGVHEGMTVNREADVSLHTQAQFHERLAQEQCEPSYMGLPYVLPLAEEYDSEDLVVEEEMEQLYLSHLNRLRAEEELKSRSTGSGAEDEGLLLLRTALQSARVVPARPQNRLLVEEISQHYTNGESGLSDEAEPEESMRMPPSSDQLLCSPGEEEGEVAILGCDLSPYPVEGMSTNKDWIPVSAGSCADIPDRVPLLLEKECKSDELGRGTVPGSPHEGAEWDLPKKEDTMDIVLPKTDSSAALLVFPSNVANEGEGVSFPEARQNTDIQMVIPVTGIQEQAVAASTGATALESGAEISPKPLQGEAMLAFNPSPALAAALSLAFRFFCVLVFLPALLDSCISLIAALLHLMSVWFL